MRHNTSRHLAVAAAVATGLVLTGCGSSGSGGAATTTAAAQTSGGQVALVAPGKLTVCTHLPYAPFQYPDETGKIIGFDVDMMDLVAKKLGVQQAIVDTPFEGIKSGQDTATGKCDISAAAISITDERKQAILFSEGYFNATQALLLRPGTSASSLADLRGKKLGAQAATTGLDYATKQAPANGYSIVEYQDVASQSQALLTGQVDAAINDLPVWSDVVKKNPGKATVGPQFDTGDVYGFGMKLGNTQLKQVVDEVIRTSKSDGTYNQLFQKWIGTEAPKS